MDTAGYRLPRYLGTYLRPLCTYVGVDSTIPYLVRGTYTSFINTYIHATTNLIFFIVVNV